MDRRGMVLRCLGVFTIVLACGFLEGFEDKSVAMGYLGIMVGGFLVGVS